jgi:hypothetical protein
MDDHATFTGPGGQDARVAIRYEIQALTTPIVNGEEVRRKREDWGFPDAPTLTMHNRFSYLMATRRQPDRPSRTVPLHPAHAAPLVDRQSVTLNRKIEWSLLSMRLS